MLALLFLSSVTCNMSTSCGDSPHVVCKGALVPFECGCDVSCMQYKDKSCVLAKCFKLDASGRCVRTGYPSVTIMILTVFVGWTGAPFFLSGATMLGVLTLLSLACTCLGRALSRERNVFGILLTAVGAIGLIVLFIVAIIISVQPWERDSDGCLTINV